MKNLFDFTRRRARIGAVTIVLLFLAACATIQSDYSAQPSRAFDAPGETTLGRAYADAQTRRPGESGFRLLNSGSGALLTRAALADLAERTIDVQYYIYDADAVGGFLLERLVAAADRGIRVRMLLDDHELGLDDSALALLDAHPNIEVRTFNPFPHRSRWSRPIQLLSRLDTLGKRMHNKVFSVDSQAAVLGGRNISNRYFDGEGESNFRDFDLLASGPVVKEVSDHFDAYWNSPIVVPVAVYPRRTATRALAEYLAELRGRSVGGVGPQAEYERRKGEFAQRLLKGHADLIWAKGTAIAEPPIRQKGGDAKSSAEVARALAIVRQKTNSEMTVATAYFVPGERGVEVLSDLVKRGVRVRVLTNSLASTDVVAVHSGYARYRPALLDAGVELHEYRVDSPRPTAVNQILRVGRSDSALHGKAVIFDRRIVWIGSANFDPRSRRLNTEDGFLVESEALAQRVLATIERDFSPENSWRVSLGEDPRTQQKRLYWSGSKAGESVRLESEPGIGPLRRLGVFFFRIIPEDQL